MNICNIKNDNVKDLSEIIAPVQMLAVFGLIFFPFVIFTFGQMQTIVPRLKFAQTQLCCVHVYKNVALNSLGASLRLGV